MASSTETDGAGTVLVTGAAGLLGSAVVEAFRRDGRTVLACDRGVLDVTDEDSVHRLMGRVRPSLVVNCAAYTRVDLAEKEPEQAWAVNRDGPATLARATSAIGAFLVHIGTDFIFDGAAERPYGPHDAARPQGTYGTSKWAGEVEVREHAGDWMIVRTSWLYGPGGRNFVDSVLTRARRGEALRIVADQTGSPTFAPGLAATLVELVGKEIRGVWHVADRGETTWYELGREACRLAGIAVEIEAVSTAEWGSPAPRPAFSVLDLGETERVLGRALPDWRTMLEHYIRAGAHQRAESLT